jgi:hypothetical protein
MRFDGSVPTFRIKLLPLSSHCNYDDAPKRQHEFTHKKVNLVVIAGTIQDLKELLWVEKSGMVKQDYFTEFWWGNLLEIGNIYSRISGNYVVRMIGGR